ncbi:hypothetical protein [Streptomyces syringium]|uniref:hypothetical protein n=1 Tax=Streptomyces syringium TaxID=76729 RepID=UPI003F541AF4
MPACCSYPAPLPADLSAAPAIRPRDPPPRGPYGESAVRPAGLFAVDPGDARVLGRDGRPHPRRVALGPHMDARACGAVAFARPGSNAPTFRQHDGPAALSFPRRLACRGALGADA